MSKLLLDLFCGAGGATKGYQDAGFYVVGVDINPQPNYCGEEFYQGDALDFLETESKYFDVIHASPPCQSYSTVTPDRTKHLDWIPETRRLLKESGKPYIIENVVGSPLVDPVRICGSSFGLDVRRHRLFESNLPLVALPCDHAWQKPRFQSLYNKMRIEGRLASVVGVHGSLNYSGEKEIREKAMGIDWMTVKELAQAIPPAYTEYLGKQAMAILDE